MAGSLNNIYIYIALRSGLYSFSKIYPERVIIRYLQFFQVSEILSKSSVWNFTYFVVTQISTIFNIKIYDMR
jgi:hypothetical protein